MLKKELIEKLKIITVQLDQISNWVWFVSAQKVRWAKDSINNLILELEEPIISFWNN